MMKNTDLLEPESSIHFFDFDGTITYSDSMFAFLRFIRGDWKFFLQMIPIVPVLIWKKISGQSSKEMKVYLLRSFLIGRNKSELNQLALAFFEAQKEKILRPKALERIHQLQEEEAMLYIVTASLDFWVKPFAAALKMRLIATQAAFDTDGVFLGIEGENCNHQEKVNRIQADIDWEEIPDSIEKVAYGNSKGDREMYAFADKFYHQIF